MDDPIFDPWCLDEAAASQPPPPSPPPPSRWRNAAKGPPVPPAQRPVRRPLERPVDEPEARTEPGASADEGPAAEVVGPAEAAAGPAEAAAGPVEDDTAVGPAEIEADASPMRAVTRRAPQDATSFLRTLLKPRIDALALRLTTARHHTTIDDRLEQDPPGLRFRIQPWTGPFSAEEQTASVLELVLEGGRHGTLAVRTWLDPLSTTPTEQRTLTADRLTEAWVDRLLLDFVEAALSGS